MEENDRTNELFGSSIHSVRPARGAVKAGKARGSVEVDVDGQGWGPSAYVRCSAVCVDLGIPASTPLDDPLRMRYTSPSYDVAGLFAPPTTIHRQYRKSRCVSHVQAEVLP
jgi:hypothetical protein